MRESSQEVLIAARQIVKMMGFDPIVIDNVDPTPPNPLNNEYRIGIQRNKTNLIEKAEERKVCIRLEKLNDKKIKYQTGFPSLLTLFGYIAVVCKGDISTISTTSSTLTWFEEWYLFFEVVYGKTCARWIDASNKYNMCASTLRVVYDRKKDIVKLAMKEWPQYVSLQEDETHRKKGKWDDYNGKRVVMFDNTNVKISQPSDSEAQRSTYSLYYSGNVGKGSVFIQPCGWMGSHEIWTGGVSDTHYMVHGKIFDSLNQYLLTSPYENDETRKVKFTIILDRGYRVTSEALEAGGHQTLQPVFSLVDRHFNTIETIISSTVSSDRSGNERAVHYLKISDNVKKGLLSAESVVRLSDTWLVWGFQINFMYLSVH
jgi:hypothetical protein